MKLTGVRNPGSLIGDILPAGISAGSYWLPLSVLCGCDGAGGDFSGDFLLSLLSADCVRAVAASGELLDWGLVLIIDRSVFDWCLVSSSTMAERGASFLFGSLNNTSRAASKLALLQANSAFTA